MDDLSVKIQGLFPKKRIVIVGDLVADQFLHGTISRVSREAPVFILRHDETDTRAGAASNAAVNISSLGARPVLVGVLGDDENGRLLLERLQGEGVDCDNVAIDASRKTTTKVRVLAGQHYAARQQVIRIDYESPASIAEGVRRQMLTSLEREADDADAIVISDYNYGVAGRDLFDLALNISKERSVPLLIDSRFRLNEFKGATTATPNQDEVEQLLGTGFSDEECSKLREELGLQSLLVTCGNKGMLLFENDKPMVSLPAVGPSEPVDVTGAGDTVIAAYALGLASGLTYPEAADVANHAGGIVVMKKGTAAVSLTELLESIRNNAGPHSLESTA
ncbi:MAG: sugar kinase [Acidobacteria bacterium]|nr:sugar kinase [Acidobacteriota bacterium]